MFKQFLSHFLISSAVFVLTSTLFIWTVDARLLNAQVLEDELNRAGVAQEIDALLPQIATAEEGASVDEKAETSTKIAQAVDDIYIGTKISEISTSLLQFIREGEPDPVIDLSDFPARLQAVGVDIGGEGAEQFEKPIALNENGNLEPVHQIYQILSAIKIVGIVVFILLLLAEYFIAEKGKKLRRVSRIFLYAGVSYLIWWGLLMVAPSILAGSLQQNVQATYDTKPLIDAILQAIQGIFASYFLKFAIGGLSIAGVLYIVRHLKHGDVAGQSKT